MTRNLLPLLSLAPAAVAGMPAAHAPRAEHRAERRDDHRHRG